MSYCIHPFCTERYNVDDPETCQECGSPLLIDGRFRLIRPIRPLDDNSPSEVFEVIDVPGNRIHPPGTHKILKVLISQKEKYVELMDREAHILKVLKHPGIPNVYIDDYFTVKPEGFRLTLHCLAIEKIDGVDLREWLDEHGKVSQSTAIDWLIQIIEILSVVHEKNYFHRDIKPSNIMLKPDGKLVLIDFGAVRDVTETYLTKIHGENKKGGLLDRDTTLVRTIGYSPPEQIRGRALPQSDFYALGRTMIHLVTGEHPRTLPEDPDTGLLVWRDLAPQIDKPLKDYIDELNAVLPGKRPHNAQVILQYLQNRLPKRIKRYRRFHSKPYQLLAVILTALVLVGLFQGGRIGISRYFFRLASESEGENNFEEAQKHYEWAIFFDPHDYASYNNLGLSCQFQKKYNCAIENFGKASELEPDNEITFYNAGGVFEDVQDYKTARLFYEKAIKISKGTHLPSRNNLARLDILEGDPQKALVSIQQVLGQDASPLTNASLYKNLGWAQFKMEQYDKALVNLERSIELDPDEASTQCLLAQTRNKKKLDAQSHWKLCLFLNSDLPEVWTWKQEFIDRLENMP
ncbi:protein kinase domain-containing protein [Acaryochloris marina NIES-2412]|uniref:protein kinase domain-containing protein n=1 Tax=Acaryochloris marina TaxID=155978 RepID=UPI0040586244